jgi:nitroreductase
MDVYEAIYNRRSVRRFTDQEVPPQVVDRLLKAACQAPTAGNLQPWRFWVVRNREVKDRLVHVAYGQSFVGQAPVVILVGADLSVSARGYGDRGSHLYSIQDTAAAIENLLLAAQAEGLGTCWVGAFNEEAARRSLGIPQTVRPVAIIPVGYPASSRHKPEREDASRLTEFVD